MAATRPAAGAPLDQPALAARLTAADVVAIRRARRDGATLRQLVERYNVDPSAISKAATGVTFRNVDEPPVPRRFVPQRIPHPNRPAPPKQRCPWFEAAFIGLTWHDARQRLGEFS